MRSISAARGVVKYAVPVTKASAPLFPLPTVALFPRASAPLHVFEPRYRQMMSAALEGDRTLIMATVRPDHVDEMGDDPPVYEIGCAGFIQTYQRLADGRFNLVLQGTQRVRIDREIPREGNRLYRIGEFTPLDDPVHDANGCAELRSAVIAHLERIAAQNGGEALEQSLGRLEGMEVGAFADGVCQALGLPTAEKQALLDAESIDERLFRLEAALGFHQAMVERGGSDDTGPASVH